jgi:ribosomal protein L11 methyltransferase
LTWLSVRVRAPAEERDAVLAALFELGSIGVHEDGDALATHFPPSIEPEVVARELRSVSPTASVEMANTPDVDWSERWRDRIVSHDVGPLTVSPPWLAHAEDAARTVVIDPGMAFGTGDHETTRGVIRLMAGVLQPGDTVADLGAGSAVLAIAAAKLGAARVAAIELDIDAIENAEANVARNGVSDRVTVLHGDAAVLLPLLGRFRVVLVNIISSVIMQLLPVIRDGLAPGGVVVLSGVLLAESDGLRRILMDSGWVVGVEDVEGEWWSAIARRV